MILRQSGRPGLSGAEADFIPTAYDTALRARRSFHCIGFAPHGIPCVRSYLSPRYGLAQFGFPAFVLTVLGFLQFGFP
jgi:hypothetical protein